MVVPNDSEMYAEGKHNPLGIILICGADCENGCPLNSIALKYAADDLMASTTVNGEPVGKLRRYEDCYLLEKQRGGLRWTANDEGQYEIAVKVHRNSNYMRIGTVIVW